MSADDRIVLSLYPTWQHINLPIQAIMKYFSLALLIASTFAFNDVDTVFFTSEDNSALYADFEALDAPVAEVWVFHQDESVFYDNTTADLADNTIYELDIESFGEGTYDVELHLTNGKVVAKQVAYTKQQLIASE